MQYSEKLEGYGSFWRYCSTFA